MMFATALCSRSTHGEGEDADEAGIQLARSVLPRVISSWAGQHGKENIANLNETGLLWKALPSRTLSDSSTTGSKVCKHRVTVVPIVTATGQVLAKAVINNSANPYAFKKSFQPSQV